MQIEGVDVWLNGGDRILGGGLWLMRTMLGPKS